VNAERALWSRDGGKSFDSVLSAAAITGASFAADGSAAWISASTGLFRAGAARDAFTRSGDADRLTCVEAHEHELWTCGHFAGPSSLRDGVGRARDPASGVFESALEFSEVTQPIACPDDSATAERCRTPWIDFYTEVTRFAASDAGVPDASAPGAASDAAAPSEHEAQADAARAADAPREDDAGSANARPRHNCGVNGGPARASLFDVALLFGVACAGCRRRSAGQRRGSRG
jgi:hypothetical protein